ncbi:hypothetical protein BCR39DRAFT_507946 [Naematelia encephala]|uniref:Uncharacterized protein n=1 Tax=Naematelia encephala TaxID=71784 RepID=A0A1Y2AKH7_9TREE|nr:hypothetical protein BCR39DRAFT_507946 [Naematelia encephala]
MAKPTFGHFTKLASPLEGPESVDVSQEKRKIAETPGRVAVKLQQPPNSTYREAVQDGPFNGTVKHMPWMKWCESWEKGDYVHRWRAMSSGERGVFTTPDTPFLHDLTLAVFYRALWFWEAGDAVPLERLNTTFDRREERTSLKISELDRWTYLRKS